MIQSPNWNIPKRIQKFLKETNFISYSTMEVEFIALLVAGKEAECLMNLLYDIELWP